MFQFIRHRNKPFLATSAKEVPPSALGIVLVSKENIYRDNLGAKPTLLLKEGYEVTQEELPRFIRNGAKPHQFYLKEQQTQLSGTPIAKPASPLAQLIENQSITIRRGMENPPRAPKIKRSETQKHILIMDPQPKSLKRSFDCFFKCGFSLDLIHPVRMSEHFHWAVKKHKPDILMVNYIQEGSISGLDLLVSLQKLASIETAILFFSNTANLSDAEMTMIKNTCKQKNIKILLKPVSRFGLKCLLDKS